jgi:hypothetical protein
VIDLSRRFVISARECLLAIVNAPRDDQPRPTAPGKITFAEMRDMGVRGLLIYCADYRCSHSIAISAGKVSAI